MNGKAMEDSTDAGMEMGVMGEKMGALGVGGNKGGLEPGRVVVVLPDMTLADFWRQQFASLAPGVEMILALGPEVAMQLASKALQLGGANYLDCVLVAPEMLNVRGPTGLVSRLKMMGFRVAAYGWQPQVSIVQTSLWAGLHRLRVYGL